MTQANNNTSSKSTKSLLQILNTKRDGEDLTKEEIQQLVDGITTGTLEDSQLGAFLMCVVLNGLNKSETAHLTEAMKNSGSVFSWPSSWIMGDKHSTGGVGDKVSLALAPALAVNGLKVPMVSGRGLGHTGGTLDKLESIPGYRVHLSTEEISDALETVGCCIVGQTASIVPADRRMYKTRDITGTVGSEPLIVSSIISKKACESLNGLVLDVKFGSGSTLGSFEKCLSLANSLVDASAALGVATTALITAMNDPVGRTIGNALEVREAIEVLRGEGPDDLIDLVVQLGGELLYCCKLCSSPASGKLLIQKSLKDSSALNKFSEMIQYQGVSKEVSEKLCGVVPDWRVLPQAKHVDQIRCVKSGQIAGMDAMKIAELCLALGAGRSKSSDKINHAVGVVLKKTVGEKIEENDVWCEVHYDDEKPLETHLLTALKSSITIENSNDKNFTSGSRVVKRISSIE